VRGVSGISEDSLLHSTDRQQALIHSNAARPGALNAHHSIKLSAYGFMVMNTDVWLPQDPQWDPDLLSHQLQQYEQISGDVVTKSAFKENSTSTTLGSKSDLGYKRVLDHLQAMAKNAGVTIARRWDAEA
jgi:hypothetical protein